MMVGSLHASSAASPGCHVMRRYRPPDRCDASSVTNCSGVAACGPAARQLPPTASGWLGCQQPAAGGGRQPRRAASSPLGRGTGASRLSHGCRTALAQPRAKRWRRGGAVSSAQLRNRHVSVPAPRPGAPLNHVPALWRTIAPETGVARGAHWAAMAFRPQVCPRADSPHGVVCTAHLRRVAFNCDMPAREMSLESRSSQGAVHGHCQPGGGERPCPPRRPQRALAHLLNTHQHPIDDPGGRGLAGRGIYLQVLDIPRPPASEQRRVGPIGRAIGTVAAQQS